MLAETMRARRRALGLTQEAAAERGDLAVRHWQKLEAARMNATLETITAVANALELDPVDLFAALHRRGKKP